MTISLPPYTGDTDLDYFTAEVARQINTGEIGGGGDVETGVDDEAYPTVGGLRVGYQDRYLDTRYGTSSTGANFTDDYTTIVGLTVFQGLRNSITVTESNNPADYTWRELSVVTGWIPSYRIAGGRIVDWDFSTTVPTNYVIDNVAGAIDLDDFATGATGGPGPSGAGVEYIFAATADTVTSIPSSQLPLNSWGYQEPGTVDGLAWVVDAAVDTDTPVLWRAQRTVLAVPTAGDVVDALWATPVVVGRFGSDGAAITGPGGSANRLDIAYFDDLAGAGGAFPSGTLAGDNYVKATRGTKGFQGTNVVTWIAGEAEPAVSTDAADYEISPASGLSTQIYFAYANTADGSGDTFATAYFDNALYVGTDAVSYVAGTTVPTQSMDNTTYEWSRLRGEDGMSITGPGGSANRLDIAYFGTEAGGDPSYPSGTIDSYTRATRGTRNFQGTNIVTWTMGDAEPAVSTTASDYEISQLAGANGLSNQIYFAYANTTDGSGTSFSTTYFDNALYVGTDVVSYTPPATPTQSTTNTDYEWSRLRGDDGFDGTSIVLNGADYFIDNRDPRLNDATTKAAFSTSFVAANPIDAMSDIPEETRAWGRFINNADDTQFSYRVWNTNTSSWSDHALDFEAPAVFSPLVITQEAVADHISVSEIFARQLRIEQNIDFEDGGGWAVGKTSYVHTADGLWIGNPQGNEEFAIVTGANKGETNEHGIEFTQSATRLFNPTISIGERAISGATSVTTSTSSITIASNVLLLSVEGVGAGGGGAGAGGAGNHGAGGPTGWTLRRNDTNAIVASDIYAGGAAASGSGAGKFRGDSGEDSAYAPGGPGGPDANANGTAGTLGSGGGGGSGRAPDVLTSSTKGGAGGSAGSHGASEVDLSNINVACTLSVTIGTAGPGSGAVDRGDGAAGGPGFFRYFVETDSLENAVLQTQAQITANTSVGVGQTWRAMAWTLNTWYENTTGRAIQVAISTASGSDSIDQFHIRTGATGNGIEVSRRGDDDAVGPGMVHIVPPGNSWRVTNDETRTSGTTAYILD